MKYEVRITAVAQEDLYSICRYVSNNDSPGKAGHLLDNIEKAAASLETMPGRGHHPPEMQRWGFWISERYFSSRIALYTKSKTGLFSFTPFLTAAATAKTSCSNGSEGMMQNLCRRGENG